MIRARNQLTLPGPAAALLGVREGDVLVIAVTADSATLRPIRRSYAGIGKGTYGNPNTFVERERADWE
ncbi:MAG: AbrB/MazE/SpoVT family DNA-binding domain-containing protein [Vulcanimicrobiaceae bacterium]